MDNKKLTQLLLEQYRTSPIIADMREADKYYRCENININQKQRGYINPKTKKFEEIKSVSNEKIASGFLRQSVNQKVAYGFGKPFVLTVDVQGEQESEAVIDLKERYSKAWDDFITPDFRKQIKSIAKEAINNGIGWGFVYIDSETQDLKILNTRSETIYPKWQDGTHQKLDAIVRDYYDLQYTENGIKNINKVEFWNDKIVEKYIASGNDLTPDTSNGDSILTHLADNQSWGKIPFIFLKGSEDELPLLKLIKSQIDGYDTLQSKSLDSLIDDVEPGTVFKNISAEIKDLTEAKMYWYMLKASSVDDNGGIDYLQANINMDSVQKKLENLKKDIKEFSCTVNTQDIQLGNNPSGVALKASYQDLDIYMNDLETEFELMIQDFKYFFDKWLVFKGEFSENELALTDITVILDRDMMMNETELIENTVKLSGTGVSQETIDNYNPAVESHEIEEQRREAEKEAESDNMYNFGEELPPENKEEQPEEII